MQDTLKRRRRILPPPPRPHDAETAANTQENPHSTPPARESKLWSLIIRCFRREKIYIPANEKERKESRKRLTRSWKRPLDASRNNKPLACLGTGAYINSQLRSNELLQLPYRLRSLHTSWIWFSRRAQLSVPEERPAFLRAGRRSQMPYGSCRVSAPPRCCNRPEERPYGGCAFGSGSLVPK